MRTPRAWWRRRRLVAEVLRECDRLPARADAKSQPRAHLTRGETVRSELLEKRLRRWHEGQQEGGGS